MPLTQTDLIGQPVITWSGGGVYAYGGPSDHPSMERTAFHLGTGGLPTHYTDFARVAPADTPVPEADPRVRNSIVKHPKRPQPHLAGPWELRLPDGPGFPSFHKTKRDAEETGRRRMAIVDWHAANAAAGQVAV